MYNNESFFFNILSYIYEWIYKRNKQIKKLFFTLKNIRNSEIEPNN
jgi:hypothetical protein